MKKNTYQTILVICLGLMILFLWSGNIWFIRISVGIGVISFLSKRIAGMIVTGWYKIAAFLGYINTRIILSMVFYFVLFPVALLSRIVSKRDKIQMTRSENSYFRVREYLFKPKDLEHPF